MKVQITLDTCDALDRDAFLALAQLLGGDEPAPSAEEPKYENTATAMPLEELSPEEEAVREEPKTISEDKWAEILLAKRKELGLVGEDGSSVGAPFASAKNEFIDYVKEQSNKYGADSPKRLTPEKLYQFVEEVFSKIVYDPATGFSTCTTANEPPF